MPRGFSLVELLVVVAIFVVITGVVLANHRQFNSSVLLGNAAYDVALSIREAQVYGLSTQGYSGAFEAGFGVRFSDATSYALFSDADRDQRYDPESGDSIITTFSLTRGFTFLRYCGVRSDGSADCSDDGALPHLTVAFLRPNPDATITGDGPLVYSGGRITVQSRDGQETRTIYVQSTGQISVSRP